jgi:high-affinity iron transporter
LLSAFLIALREGVEAALVVGIVLVYLSRTGRSHLVRYVWSGVAAAAALSLAVAVALERWQVSRDGFEGLLLLIASVFVITMIVWMNRVARHLRKEIESRVASYAERAGRAAGWGLFLFVFLMVLREGAELALILRAVELSTEGLQTWVGTLGGIAVAVAVGLFFFKGTLQVPLPRFFAATSLILMIVAFQLALTGLHELSEARWLPSSKGEMAVIGPIVRNDLFFFVFIFGAAVLLVLREWTSLTRQEPAGQPPQPVNDAERRRSEWNRRRQRRWMMATAAVCLAVVMALTADFIYAKAHAAPPEAQPIEARNGEVRIPLASVQDSNLHLFTVRVDGNALRFLVIRKPNGWGTALDACRICGAVGYHQDGQNVICRHCGSAIYVPSIGDQGGCNPVGVPSHVEGADLVLSVASLTQAEGEVPK